MRERGEQILRIACLALAVLLAFQIVRAIVRSNPLLRVTVPAVPTLAADTNAPVTAGKPASAAAQASAGSPTNTVSRSAPAATETNTVVRGEPQKAETNPGVPVSPSTNAPGLQPAMDTATVNTNAAGPQPMDKPGTNSIAVKAAEKAGTNSVSIPADKKRPPGPDVAMMGMNPAGKKLPELSPAIKARVDKIVESELLGQVMRPQPMALLGIAGDVAFLRSPTGQTGLVKEGDSLGELKLLRIGVNRVLVEEGGQKKELMIFSGYGGDSLLSKTKETSDESPNK